MDLAIKTGEYFFAQIKYIVINESDNVCQLIPAKKLADDEKDKIRSLIEKEINGYKIEFARPLPIEKEIYFLWPQIITEVKDKFPFVNGWLIRAHLNIIEKKILEIKVENKVAFETISNPTIKYFLQKKFNDYLNCEFKIKIINGDFLQEIPEQPPVLFNKIENRQTMDKMVDKEIGRKKESAIIMGRNIIQKRTHKLFEIESELDKVVVIGKIFTLEKIKTKKGNNIIIFNITDNTDSITTKIFLTKKRNLNGELKKGDWLKIRGYIQNDMYSKELTLIAQDINVIKPESKKDECENKRVELHLHSRMSAMDSVVDIEEAVKRAAEWGHPAIAITDHGVVQSFPDAYKAGNKYGIKVIFGMEAYMVDDGEPIILNPNDQKIKETTFTVFDLETTGLKNHVDEIIEIGAVKISENKIIDKFATFVNPQKKIPSKITEITGITDEMVLNAPTIDKIIDDFVDFVDDSVLVAHNASFDYNFFRVALKKTRNIELKNSVLDTLNLSRALFPNFKNHKLDTLSRHFKVELENHHRAVDDAEATADIFLKLIDILEQKEIHCLNEINELSKSIDWKSVPTYHLVILAKNQAGLKDLYRLVSTSHLHHFYRRPRILKSELLKKRHNFILGSACEAGLLYRSIIQNKTAKEIENIAKFYDYLEIQPIGNNLFLIPDQIESKEELQNINRKIYELGKKLNKPVVGTCDVHFLDPEDGVYRKILQAGQGYEDYDRQAPLYFRNTEEMLAEFSYFGKEIAEEIVIENTNKISDMIDILRPVPEGVFPPKIDGADQEICEMAYKKAHELYGESLPELIEKRLAKELKAIIDNGYAVNYLIAEKLVKKSLNDGYLVGSRGSVGSSFAATMCDITEVNPLPPHYYCDRCKHIEFITDDSVASGPDLPDKKCPNCAEQMQKDGFEIPFEVFMGFKGDKVPDIDLNFSGEYQSFIHKYTEELFGRDYVFKAGTISTVAERTAYGFVRNYLDEKDLSFRQAEVTRLVKGCAGVRRTTGQHPGGLIIVPNDKEIFDFCPIQHPANDMNTDVRTTHFDYHSIHDNLLKLDLLGHDAPTIIRMLQDLIQEINPDFNPQKIPLDDQETMQLFSSTEPLGLSSEDLGTTIGTYGIPEFGTTFVRGMLEETRPNTFAELVRISGLSHGTEVWLNNAQNLIQNGTAKLAEVISVRDDILNYLLHKGLENSIAFKIMEKVRKGKGLTEEEEDIMRSHNVPDWYINSCKKIKYMFPKAHAVAYTMMAFRIAYCKVHYPLQFYAACFSIKASDFDAQIICEGEKQVLEVKQMIEAKGNDASVKEKCFLIVLEIVLEALLRGVEFAKVDLYLSDPKLFLINKETKKLIPPFISLQGLGESAAANIAKARKEGEFSSIEDLVNRTRISKTVVEVMKTHGTLDGLPEKNQLSLF